MNTTPKPTEPIKITLPTFKDPKATVLFEDINSVRNLSLELGLTHVSAMMDIIMLLLITLDPPAIIRFQTVVQKLSLEIMDMTKEYLNKKKI